MIEYNLFTNDFNQKEVLFECDIPKFSKVIACPNSQVKAAYSLSQVLDGTRIFCIGGFITFGAPPEIKAVDWTLEYVKEPCFI